MKSGLRAGILRFCLISSLMLSMARAQQVPSAPQEPLVKITKLSPPVYPPLTREAHIAGDVVVRLLIGQDGTVKSAAVVSGHPRLKQAALDSAKNSEFECEGCGISGASYLLTYTFGFYPDGGCGGHLEARAPRSGKCLYLWRCGTRNVSASGQDNRAPTTTRSGNHVTLLVSSVCLQTQTAEE